jgi:hypothetical protein
MDVTPLDELFLHHFGCGKTKKDESAETIMKAAVK